MVFNLGSTSTRRILFPTFMISRLDICRSQNIQIVDWFYVHDLCYILLPGGKSAGRYVDGGEIKEASCS